MKKSIYSATVPSVSNRIQAKLILNTLKLQRKEKKKW